MFENLIGQRRAASLLKEQFVTGTFPQASLFFGPFGSGKLTAALESARILNCSQEGAWKCGCPSCSASRELRDYNLIIAGYRPFYPEVAIAAENFVAERSSIAYLFFVRSIRKLTRRFDPLLWEGEERKLAQAQKIIEPIEEKLADFELQLESGEGFKEESVEPLLKSLQTLISHMPTTVPIRQIRSLTHWARQTVNQGKRVIIIEGAEKIQENARNALLKLLEEPPRSTHILLLSSSKEAIIPTLLSRLRPYLFSERPLTVQKEVLRKIFKRDIEEATSITHFLSHYDTPPLKRLQRVAKTLFEAVESGNLASLEFSLLDYKFDNTGFQRLLFSLTELLAGELCDMDPDLLLHWESGIKRAKEMSDVYNVAPVAAVESLYHYVRSRY